MASQEIDTSRPITIAIDAMGGYGAPTEVVGAVAALSRQLRRGDPAFFTLVGDEAQLHELLFQTSHNPERISIHHAPSAIEMGEPGRTALSQKSDTSIDRACALVAEGEADAVVTAGHPGAAVVSALEHFGTLAGIEQVALASVYPTAQKRGESGDRLSLLLDVGATLRAEPRDLLHFAVMGSAYARIVSRVERPRVALLSTSREPRIGPPEVVEAYQLLRDHPGINFQGNVEGHQIPSGDFDVVVCEGFVGDVVLKLLEGAATTAFELARAAYERKMAWRAGLRLLSTPLAKIKQVIDFEEYGGAPLLGLDRVMILAHPRSRSKAIANAIKLAVRNARADLPREIAAILSA